MGSDVKNHFPKRQFPLTTQKVAVDPCRLTFHAIALSALPIVEVLFLSSARGLDLDDESITLARIFNKKPAQFTHCNNFFPILIT